MVQMDFVAEKCFEKTVALFDNARWQFTELFSVFIARAIKPSNNE